MNCVCYVIDGYNEKYNKIFNISIKSLLKNNNYDVYILTQNKNLNLSSNNIKNIDCNNYADFLKSKIIKNYGVALLKLFIPQFDFFYRYDKILYLDCDTIILKKLDDFFNVDVENYQILGIDDTIFRNNDITKYKIYNYYKLKKYINCGVMIYNSKEFNKDKNLLTINDCIKLYNKLDLKLYDQDLINVFYNIKCIYNYEYNSYYFLKMKDCYIKHYTTIHKDKMLKEYEN